MTLTVDVSGIAAAAREDQILAAIDRLGPGKMLDLVADHRPSPLRHQLEATLPGEYRWDDGETGPRRCTARITAVARVVDARPDAGRWRGALRDVMWLTRASARLRDDRSFALRRRSELLDARGSGLSEPPYGSPGNIARGCGVEIDVGVAPRERGL